LRVAFCFDVFNFANQQTITLIKMKKITCFVLFAALFCFGALAQSADTEKNLTDQNGLKQGFWEEEIGRSKITGTYVDDLRHGNWVYYHPNGIVQTLQYYNMGKKEGIFIEIDNKGYFVSEKNYKNDQLHGATKVFERGSRLILEENYKEGKLHGQKKAFYSNGRPQEESMYVEGLKEGPAKWFGQEGNLIAEYNYKDGMFDGVQKNFDENGNVLSEENYEKNVKSGLFTEYHPNGQINIQGTYKDGKKEGVWKSFDEAGKLISETKYKNGAAK